MINSSIRLFFLIVIVAALSLFIMFVTSCGSNPIVQQDVKWEFLIQPGQPIKACLIEDDLAKLRARLDRCEAK